MINICAIILHTETLFNPSNKLDKRTNIDILNRSIDFHLLLYRHPNPFDRNPLEEEEKREESCTIRWKSASLSPARSRLTQSSHKWNRRKFLRTGRTFNFELASTIRRRRRGLIIRTARLQLFKSRPNETFTRLSIPSNVSTYPVPSFDWFDRLLSSIRLKLRFKKFSYIHAANIIIENMEQFLFLLYE